MVIGKNAFNYNILFWKHVFLLNWWEENVEMLLPTFHQYYSEWRHALAKLPKTSTDLWKSSFHEESINRWRKRQEESPKYSVYHYEYIFAKSEFTNSFTVYCSPILFISIPIVWIWLFDYAVHPPKLEYVWYTHIIRVYGSNIRLWAKYNSISLRLNRKGE